MKLKVANIDHLTDKVVKMDLEVLEPKDFSFKSGQHITIKTDEKEARPYSIYSNLEDSNKIAIVASIGHEGIGANYLKELKVGDEIDAIGPLGRFVIQENHKKNILFVATGTGISPLLTMLHKMQKEGLESNIEVLFGVKNEEEVYFIDVLDEFKQSFKSFDYKVCYSSPTDPEGKNVGYVDKFVEIKDLENTQVYMCGLSKMVESLTSKLVSFGMKEEDLIS